MSRFFIQISYMKTYLYSVKLSYKNNKKNKFKLKKEYILIHTNIYVQTEKKYYTYEEKYVYFFTLKNVFLKFILIHNNFQKSKIKKNIKQNTKKHSIEEYQKNMII